MNKLPYIICLFFAFLIGIAISGNLKKDTPPVINTPPRYLFVDYEKLFINVNKWRQSKGFQPYIQDEWLCQQADIRAFEIQSDYSHTGFDRYRNKYNLAENLSEGYDENHALSAWLDSPSHAENLNANYQYSCIRCVEYRCVQMFGNF